MICISEEGLVSMMLYVDACVFNCWIESYNVKHLSLLFSTYCRSIFLLNVVFGSCITLVYFSR